MKVVGNSLKKGSEISLIRFSTFEMKHRESKLAGTRNPEQIIQIPAKSALSREDVKGTSKRLIKTNICVRDTKGNSIYLSCPLNPI